MDGASRTVTRLSLELGGNAPVLVYPDVNMDTFVDAAVYARLRNNGQVCISPQRFIVHSQIVEEFVDRVTTKMKTIKLGNGLDPATEVGPLINPIQLERVEKLVGAAVSAGADVVYGGGRATNFDKGYFYTPTVIANVSMQDDIARAEIFGPVMPIIPFSDPDEALAIANDTEYGLAAYLWTNDIRIAVKMYEGLEFGMIGLNDWAPNSTEAPFAGWKQSGIGAELGTEGLSEYMETKLVVYGDLLV